MSQSGTLRLILGDQLSRDVSSLSDADPKRDLIVMAEVRAEATYVKHHKKKIAFVFSAMRHFAQALEADGFRVAYTAYDDPDNTGSLRDEVARALKGGTCDRVVVTEAGEYRLRAEISQWAESLDCPVEVREDDRFLCSHERFGEWAEGRKALRMEYFYREMRKETGLLMTKAGEPEGGEWNYDSDNRKPLPQDMAVPERFAVAPDAITRDVLRLVEDQFSDHFGTLEPFDYAVCAEGAQAALEDFLDTCLPSFGDYQDAMKAGEPFLFHSLIALYLNAGLLDARKICEQAAARHAKGKAPLNAVEGFIRQILGWREYIRGIYWLKMPDYAQTNALKADRPLPAFFWTGETKMACIRDVVETTRAHAYAHHIQRLMITGNFALLAGIDPKAVNEWYLIVYADAYEWVQLPNTHGMALFADGGVLASKPYAASGAYINRMSDYCKGCSYSVSKKAGEKACPFNYLYWFFLMENREQLGGNPRLAMPYRTLDKMDDAKRKTIAEDSERFLRDIGCLSSKTGKKGKSSGKTGRNAA